MDQERSLMPKIDRMKQGRWRGFRKEDLIGLIDVLDDTVE